jgi:hypothetical protein
MLKWFIHPKTKEKLLVNDCLEKGLLSEYFPLAYLTACAQEREWKGKCSTTQLLNGARQNYLKLLVPYAINPDDNAFMILGTKSHLKLENLTPKSSFAEMGLQESEITGIADLLEQQPNGEWWLTDYKTSGSYAVMLTLGLVKQKRLAFDDQGNPILYQKSGRWGKRGDQKLEDFWIIDESKKDYKNYQLQLNKYRKEIEAYFDIKISKLRIFFTARDGGCLTAKQRGILNNTYYIDIPFLTNDEVDNYFNKKKDELLKALKSYDMWLEDIDQNLGYKKQALFKFMPEACNYEESWRGGNKCNYCPVVNTCILAGNPYKKEVTA